ncbi:MULTISPECIES: aromatic-ring-hydroxylating dioxygenase subunit beta [unclassified Acidovorax]|uniref:aromatic-ring-hydroxylating dioxygenase subunit beta n=1 Tax=unclassified Acidovorax TaxID=2684926 RepID=UPI0028833B77|nr:MULTISPECIES: aromatic-ring-hydroxylating dioxygenase subunit beta [unclassified Acidovorax]
MLLDHRIDLALAPTEPCDLDLAALRGVEQALFHEARLLDERRFHEWLALWTDEGRYWVPRHHDQVDPFEQISLFWEDRMLRETRVRRLLNARNWSQQPVTRSSRLVGNIQVEGFDAAGHLIVRSNLQYTEYRLQQRQLAGQVFHKLAPAGGGGWKLQLKRVNLVSCDSVFASLEVFI